jgi:hypothetical protein
MDATAITMIVLLGDLGHSLAAQTDAQPDRHATIGLLPNQRGDEA